jgi:hypothetical protein
MEDLKLGDLRSVHTVPVKRNVIIIENMVFGVIALDKFKNLTEGPHAYFTPARAIIRKILRTRKAMEASQDDEMLAPKKLAQHIYIEVADVAMGMTGLHE